MDGRVGELALTVRATPARWPDLRPRAERFASRVLERTDALLERRAPGRVVLLRTLDMRWRLQEAALDRDSEVEAFAEEIAASVDASARAARGEPVAGDDIAVFEDEVAWRAAYLLAVVRERSVPWFFGQLAVEGDPPGILAEPGQGPLATAVVLRLGRGGVLAEVLNGLSVGALERLCGAVCVEDSRLDEKDPRMTATARRRRAIARLMAIPREATWQMPPSVGTEEPTTGDEPSVEADATPGAGPGVWQTAHAGLFYLLNPALELDLGELLWKACLDERAFLAIVAAHCIGSNATDDPAPALFGGAPVPAALPPVARELQAEIADGLLEALVRALPSRGLATFPPTTLGVTGERGRRLLVVTPRNSSFVMFAAPVESPAAASEALARFLARWPSSTEPPRASPALADLDAGGRVVAERGLAPSAWTPQDVADASTTPLLAQVVGVLGYLFVARAHAYEVTAPALLAERCLAVRGRIAVSDDTMTVELPMERVDLGVRRGGLDRDPGWVPWLRKRVELVFVGDGEDPGRASG